MIVENFRELRFNDRAKFALEELRETAGDGSEEQTGEATLTFNFYADISAKLLLSCTQIILREKFRFNKEQLTRR